MHQNYFQFIDVFLDVSLVYIEFRRNYISRYLIKFCENVTVENIYSRS